MFVVIKQGSFRTKVRNLCGVVTYLSWFILFAVEMTQYTVLTIFESNNANKHLLNHQKK